MSKQARAGVLCFSGVLSLLAIPNKGTGRSS
jgi:hypothetical protein